MRVLTGWHHEGDWSLMPNLVIAVDEFHADSNRLAWAEAEAAAMADHGIDSTDAIRQIEIEVDGNVIDALFEAAQQTDVTTRPSGCLAITTAWVRYDDPALAPNLIAAADEYLMDDNPDYWPRLLADEQAAWGFADDQVRVATLWVPEDAIVRLFRPAPITATVTAGSRW